MIGQQTNQIGIKKMSGKNKESISDKKISRRSMLKWTGTVAAAAVIGIGAGYETNQLLRPITTVTQTATQTVPSIEDQVFATTTHGGTLFAHIRNGQISWVEPFYYTKNDATAWTITAGGKSFTSPTKFPLYQFAYVHRRMVYAPERLRYPMKRVGFAPGGTSDVSNRGKGEFVRITWQEALDTVANEMKRIIGKYGNSAITWWKASHVEMGSYAYGEVMGRFIYLAGGGTTRLSCGHSFVGWFYGSPYIWGFEWQNSEGDTDDLLQDTMQNSKLVVFWGNDPVITSGLNSTHSESIYRYWLKDLGIRMVFISPHFDETAASFSDQWIPIYPGTDTALALAIANVWIKEGTYDKQYVSTHTVGFDKFSDYVLGKAPGVDGAIDRTADWASKITGIDSQTITNLAREWGSKPTNLAVYTGGAQRTNYGHELARMWVTLQAMQGLGKPGVSITGGGIGSVPLDKKTMVGPPAYGPGAFTLVAKRKPTNPIKAVVPMVNMPLACLNPPFTWKGGSSPQGMGENHFIQYTYPSPGSSEIKMLWRYGAGTFNEEAGATNYAKWYRSPKLEFFALETINLEPEALYADIVLPACTALERNDLTKDSNNVVIYQRKLIEPLYESKVDWDIFMGVAERLGLKEALTEGNSEDDWLRLMYNASTVPLSWEAFKAKGYYIFQIPQNYQPNTAFRWFYQKSGDSITGASTGLNTPSGKIEIYCKMLADQYGENSNAIGAVPHYFPDPEGRLSQLAAKYPVQLITPHPKFRLHDKFGNVPWSRDIYKYNGYEPVRINPADASVRGIKEKDTVRIFNDRGQSLFYAHLTERVRQGVIAAAYGSWWTPADPTDPTSLDKAGNPNTLTPMLPMSPHAFCDQFNCTLVQFEKWMG